MEITITSTQNYYIQWYQVECFQGYRSVKILAAQSSNCTRHIKQLQPCFQALYTNYLLQMFDDVPLIIQSTSRKKNVYIQRVSIHSKHAESDSHYMHVFLQFSDNDAHFTKFSTKDILLFIEQHVLHVLITVGDLLSFQICAICKFFWAEHILFDSPPLQTTDQYSFRKKARLYL